ncbi:hypothetical protein BT69DRAFT_208785 [Atractiella rhizophila]|nr:hypothetical protein BT69DRAFT_208785 [Atractiella rhizophila]
MEKRKREPSRLAREIAEAQAEAKRGARSAQPEKKRKVSRQTSKTAKPKPKSRTKSATRQADESNGLEFVESKGGYDANGTWLYCICLGEEDASRAMIQCDSCLLWHHLSCVGFTEEEAKQIDDWYCDKCIESGAKPVPESEFVSVVCGKGGRQFELPTCYLVTCLYNLSL